MKDCISCKKEKPKTSEYFFYRNKFKGWLSSWCKECRKTNRIETKDLELKQQRIRRNNKPRLPIEEKVKLLKRPFCVVCGTVEKTSQAKTCVECAPTRKREQKREDKAIYKSRLRKAMPSWADKKGIKDFYKNRPDSCHVDHIIPIRGVNISGLHILANLQYLPKLDNMKKSNHYSLEHEGRK